MKHKLLSIDEIRQDRLAYNPFIEIKHQGSNKSTILKQVIDDELTDRQRQCISMYFGMGLKIDSIAEEIGVTKGTVSKHIAKGKIRIQKCLEYSDFGKRYYM